MLMPHLLMLFVVILQLVIKEGQQVSTTALDNLVC